MLRKEPAGKEVGDGDAFSFNEAFSEKLYRLRINTIQLRETEEENVKTNEQARARAPFLFFGQGLLDGRAPLLGPGFVRGAKGRREARRSTMCGAACRFSPAPQRWAL